MIAVITNSLYDDYMSTAAGVLCLDFIHLPGNPEAFLESGPLDPRTHVEIRRFRTALQRLLDAEARGIGARESDLAALNRILSRAGGKRGLRPTVRGYGWGWLSDGSEDLSGLLWPVAWSAARLLDSPDLARLKACSCGRLFLDASRNRSRRWCDKAECGNRANVARFRSRQR
ncbi:MAG: CGNR zinc finger domain-containing protein [Gemmatimonadales bacterium]